MFDSEDDNPSERIVFFLFENQDQKFTTSQVADETGLAHEQVETILPQLNERRFVVHEEPYWEITDDTERLSSAYSLHKATERLNERYGTEDREMWAENAPNVEEHPNYEQ